MSNERPKYQGVIELAFLAITPEQLLSFRSKEEYNDFVFLTQQCSVQEKSVKLLKESEEVETTNSSTQKKKIGALWQGLGKRFNNHKKRKFSLKDSHKELYYGLDQKYKSSSSATDVSASSTLSPAASATTATLDTTHNYAIVIRAAAAAAASAAAATTTSPTSTNNNNTNNNN